MTEYYQFSNCKMPGSEVDTKAVLRQGTTLLCQDKDGKEVLVKKISVNWTINSYVSNEIAKVFLGEDIVVDVRIEKAGKRPVLVTKIQDNFQAFANSIGDLSADGNYNQVHLPYAYKYSVGGYNITDQKGSLVYKPNNYGETYFNGKPVYGFYNSFALTLLIDDHDTENGNNYALIEKGDSYEFTRFDFDDSLKFYDILRLAKFHTTIPSGIKNQLEKLGVKTNKQFSKFMHNQLETEVFPALSGFFKSGVDYQDFDMGKMVDAINELENQFDEILRAVDNAYEELGRVYSERVLSKTYKTKKLDCHNPAYQGKRDIDKLQNRDLNKFCSFNPEDSTIDKIKEYTKYHLRKRMDELLKAKLCLEMPYSSSGEIDLSVQKEAVLQKHNYDKLDFNGITIYMNPEGETPYCMAYSQEHKQIAMLLVNNDFVAGEYDHYFVS